MDPENDIVPRPTPLNFSEITSDESSLFNKTEDTSNLTEDKTFEDDKENRLGNATTRAARLDTLAATVDSHLKQTAWKYRTIKEILNDP